MKLLIIDASPKKKGSASRFLSTLLRASLAGIEKETFALRDSRDIKDLLPRLTEADAVCISFPLYVDSLPSHVTAFLTAAENYFCCRNIHPGFRLYAIANNGFIEGSQNSPALNMLRAWCERTGMIWSGGIGIGGGTMLRGLWIAFPAIIAIMLALVIFTAVTGSIPCDFLISLAINTAVWLFLSSGALYALSRLASAVRGEAFIDNIYTRVMIPSFIFVPVADLFMILSSLFQGRFLFTLLKRDEWDG